MNGIISRSAILILAAAAIVSAPAQAQKEAVPGTVRGVVQTKQGKVVGGFWLIIDNGDLGMNYRKDVNPIGRFEFTDVYPGSYIFRISPDSYTVLSPAKIQVESGRAMDVTVVVAPRPNAPPPTADSK